MPRKAAKKKPLTLLQLWAARQIAKPETTAIAQLPPAQSQPTKRQRKLARILKVSLPKVRRKTNYPRLGPSGKMPTVRFVQGGRPGSKR